MPQNKDFEIKNGLKVGTLLNANAGVVAVTGNTTVSGASNVSGNSAVGGNMTVTGNTSVAGLFTYKSSTIAVTALGTVSASGTATLNYSSGAFFTVTHSGSLTFDFTNLPVGYWELSVISTNAGLGSIAIKVAGVNSSVRWVKGDGTSSTTFSTMGVTLQASGTNHFVFWGVGSTVYGRAA